MVFIQPVDSLNQKSSIASEKTRNRNNNEQNNNIFSSTKIIIEGDSLSEGYGAQLKKLLGDKVDTVNLAHHGDTVIKHIEPELQSVIDQYDPNKKNNIVVLAAGTNDLHNGASAQKVYDHLIATAKKLKENGFKVVVGTSIKLTGSGKYAATPKELKERQEYNELIRSSESAPWDEVVDLASLPEFDDNPNSKVTNNPAIYAPDRVHLTSTGYKYMATKFEEGIVDILNDKAD